MRIRLGSVIIENRGDTVYYFGDKEMTYRKEGLVSVDLFEAAIKAWGIEDARVDAFLAAKRQEVLEWKCAELRAQIEDLVEKLKRYESQML